MNFFTKKLNERLHIIQCWIWVFKNYYKFQSAFGMLHFEKSSKIFLQKFAKKSSNLHKGVSSNFNNNRNHHYTHTYYSSFIADIQAIVTGYLFIFLKQEKNLPRVFFRETNTSLYSLYCCIVRCCNFLHIWRAASKAPHSELKLKKQYYC